MNNKKSKVFFGVICTTLSLFSFTAIANDGEKITEFHLESSIVGDNEQPAVSNFIPWQGTSAPDKLQWDLDVKYDKTLDLIDRDVMLRSLNIYNEMNLESSNTVD